MTNIKDLFRFIMIDILFLYYFNIFYIESVVIIYIYYIFNCDKIYKNLKIN